MRAMRLPAASLNQSAPSRSAIESGRLPGVMPVLNSVTLPSGVMRPIWPASLSENQILPSGPAKMPSGPAADVGRGKRVISPRIVMRPTLFAFLAQNQMLPSGPAAMPIGVASASGSGNSVNVPAPTSRRPILEAPLSQNHSCRSGPG